MLKPNDSQHGAIMSKKQFTFNIYQYRQHLTGLQVMPSITGTGAGSFIVDRHYTAAHPGRSGNRPLTFHPPLGSQGQTLTANIACPDGGPCGNALNIDLNGHRFKALSRKQLLKASVLTRAIRIRRRAIPGSRIRRRVRQKCGSRLSISQEN